MRMKRVRLLTIVMIISVFLFGSYWALAWWSKEERYNITGDFSILERMEIAELLEEMGASPSPKRTQITADRHENGLVSVSISVQLAEGGGTTTFFSSKTPMAEVRDQLNKIRELNTAPHVIWVQPLRSTTQPAGKMQLCHLLICNNTKEGVILNTIEGRLVTSDANIVDSKTRAHLQISGEKIGDPVSVSLDEGFRFDTIKMEIGPLQKIIVFINVDLPNAGIGDTVQLEILRIITDSWTDDRRRLCQANLSG